jgi:hypothetical protein
MKNQQNIPKWVKRIRLQPEVTASFIMMAKLNPLKDYEVLGGVASSELIHKSYRVVNEIGAIVFIPKFLAYEVKRPLVSTTKALVQLSKRKFVAGTMVRVVNPGECYSTSPELAEELGLLEYNSGGWHSDIIRGKSGMVLGQDKTSRGEVVYGLRVEGKGYILEEGALEAIHNV